MEEERLLLYIETDAGRNNGEQLLQGTVQDLNTGKKPREKILSKIPQVPHYSLQRVLTHFEIIPLRLTMSNPWSFKYEYVTSIPPTGGNPRICEATEQFQGSSGNVDLRKDMDIDQGGPTNMSLALIRRPPPPLVQRHLIFAF